MKRYNEVLKVLEKNGFIAYIVGGFVRNKLLKINNTDIDIITDATPNDMKKIFKLEKVYENYGSVKLKIESNLIDITTFRRELSYKNGKLEKIEFIKDLKADLMRRDFTINAICMDSKGNYVDPLNGIKDLKNKVVKTIRSAKIEFEEDPTRIIRALRFMCELNFKLDDEILNYITTYPNSLSKINIVKRKQELDKIFKSKNVTKFLNFIKEYKLENYLGIKSNNFKYTSNILGVWSQLEIEDYHFTKSESKQIKDIKELLKKGKIDKYDLYKKGLKLCVVAAEILEIDKKELNKIYTNLPIKGIIDININCDEIYKYVNISSGKELGNILKLLEKEILEGKIKNEKVNIIQRLNGLR